MTLTERLDRLVEKMNELEDFENDGNVLTDKQKLEHKKICDKILKIEIALEGH